MSDSDTLVFSTSNFDEAEPVANRRATILGITITALVSSRARFRPNKNPYPDIGLPDSIMDLRLHTTLHPPASCPLGRLG